MSSPAVSQPDVGVVVVAAGAGVRAGPGEPKQFRPILGVPMVLRALRAFTGHPEVRHVIVALPPEYARRPPEWLATLRGERLAFVPGGAQRFDSVRAGLEALPAEVTIVLVHDAARPFVSRGTIDAVIARARAGVGAVAGVPNSDTLKEIGQGAPRLTPRITRTVDRERIWRAQTPQGFPRQMLGDAYRQLRAEPAKTANGAAPPPADDAEVCERAGFPVELIPDSPYNFKITTADDFRIAEALARELR
ncbi:MAG: 2-C-methyl-D-erythritol 4-phosphate cytidylyltransferase [Gemmatimonadetes bacterium]|nr:MAG: 2-C-methyl-D-erythritol 4-phosphate cytidylyltransferase [Gemmatimonadota bacterium]